MAKKATPAKKVAAKKVVKKASPKKAAPKKVAVKKEERKKLIADTISAKQIGKNLIVIIDGKKYTKIAPTTSEITSIKTKILLYNKKNDPSKKEELLRLIDKTVVEKEKKAAVKAGVKAIVKKEAKNERKEVAELKKVEKDKMGLIDELSEKAEKDGLNQEETEKLKRLMKAAGFVEEKQQVQATVAPVRRSGEH